MVALHTSIAIVAIILLIGLALFIRRSLWGRQVQAVAQNRLGASIAGIDTARASSIIFMASGAIVEEADCLALVPRMVAQELAKSRDIRILDIDYPERRLDIDAFWTQAAGAKRGHAWFQSLLPRAAQGLPSRVNDRI